MPNLPNGQYSPGSETIGSIRQISCHNGYELDGSSMIFCLANETWTKPGSHLTISILEVTIPKTHFFHQFYIGYFFLYVKHTLIFTEDIVKVLLNK